MVFYGVTSGFLETFGNSKSTKLISWWNDKLCDKIKNCENKMKQIWAKTEKYFQWFEQVDEQKLKAELKTNMRWR